MSTNKRTPLTPEQVAVFAEKFEADPVGELWDWAEGFANRLMAREGLGPATPREMVDMYGRISPEVIDFIREHGYVSNEAACAVSYVAIGSNCNCPVKHEYTWFKVTPEQEATVAKKFEADPIRWICGLAEGMRNKLLALGDLGPVTPEEKAEIASRVTPSVIEFVRSHGYVSRDASCAIWYAATGAECEDTPRHEY